MYGDGANALYDELELTIIVLRSVKEEDRMKIKPALMQDSWTVSLKEGTTLSAENLGRAQEDLVCFI